MSKCFWYALNNQLLLIKILNIVDGKNKFVFSKSFRTKKHEKINLKKNKWAKIGCLNTYDQLRIDYGVPHISDNAPMHMKLSLCAPIGKFSLNFSTYMLIMINSYHW